LKWYGILFGLLLLGTMSFAMSNATGINVTERGRWAGLAGSWYTTEGGNISAVNLTGATLTDRWAAFYGNVTGNIRLTDLVGTNNLFNWTWTPGTGGEVCFSTAGNFTWSDAATATGANVNTAFGLGNAADSANNTFTDAVGCNLNFTQAFVGNSAKAVHSGSSTFWTCAIKDAFSGSKGDYAFCTNISSAGKNWNNEGANYEVMVPTTPGVSNVETYYVFAELN